MGSSSYLNQKIDRANEVSGIIHEFNAREPIIPAKNDNFPRKVNIFHEKSYILLAPNQKNYTFVRDLLVF